MTNNKNSQLRAAKLFVVLGAIVFFAAPAAQAYFDTLPPISVVTPVVSGVTIVDTPIVVTPVVAPPGAGTPPTVSATPEPATLLMALSAAGVAGVVARRRK